MNSQRIAVIPGDGIGKEVVPEGMRVLEKVSQRFGLALQFDPRLADGFATRATVHYRKREYDKALADCNQALQLDPSQAWTYSLRAAAYTCKKEDEKALADCDEALRRDAGQA